MTGKNVQVFIFGDQSQDTTAKLRVLLEVKDNPILISFLQKAYNAIRTEVAEIPLHERQLLPRFCNLADLVARQKEGSLTPAFQTALACTCQLGYFIRRHGLPNRPYPRPDDTYLLGLCTGALAAASISSCSSLSELLAVAEQTVTIAFRLGLLVVEVGKRLEPYGSTSWSVIFPGVKPGVAATTIGEFVKAQQIPPHSRPWISAQFPNGTSISGPPSILEKLRKFRVFSDVYAVDIPVRVPGHAPHLFTDEDVDHILKTTGQTPWAHYRSRIPVISPVDGTLMQQKDTSFRSLLESCLQDILAKPLRWDCINEQFPRLLLKDEVTAIKLVPFMTTTENSLKQTLESFSDGSAGSPNLLNSSGAFKPIEIDNFDNIEKTANVNTSGSPGLSKLAIVGFAGRFPDAEDSEAFWEILRKGIDTVKKVPPKRWNIDTHVDSSGRNNTGEVPWGCWIPNVSLFDARFFSISPKEAPQMDPAQRLSLMTTYEAMENAGIVPGTTPSTKTDRIGSYLGVTSNDYMETNTSQAIDTHFITGGNRAFIPGRINFCFEFCGPSYSVDTACSSSLAAMHLACNALWRGDVDTAFACGTNMINNPDGHAGLDRGFFLSKTGNCKPFDDGADGYCRGEGVVTTILKRLEDALADNDPILAVIAGTQTNHSGESDSITRPHAGAQKALFDRVLNATGTNASEVSYIEMHGTGTQVGDAVEMESVLDVFAPEPKSISARPHNSPLYLGAAKGNIGHGEGVSGVTSVAKVLLMYEKGIIPPHCGIRTKINHNYPLDFEERNVHIATRETPWLRTDSRPRKVLINNFSAAGGNTALLLEDAPAQPLDSENNRSSSLPSTHMVAISAKCAESLKGNLKSTLRYLMASKDAHDPNFSLDRLAYTTTARRLHHQHRVMVHGSNIDDVKQRLEEAIAGGYGLTRPKSAPKIMFAFTGQGSHYLGMAKQLFQTFSSFRQDVQRFEKIAHEQGFPSFSHIYLADDGQDSNDWEDFSSPPVVQLAICCLQMALARLWKSWGVTPDSVVGHSLGEYAALNAAGVLSDSDTIYLVGKRAELLQQECRAGTHAMLAIKASAARSREILASYAATTSSNPQLQISCMNGPDDTVLGGRVEHISAFKDALSTQGVKATLLRVPFAFHTSQVFPILGDFEASARGITFHKPHIPVVSSVLGSVVNADTALDVFSPKYLTRHCRETVNIYEGLIAARKADLLNDRACVIEIGPSPIILGMVKATLGGAIKTLPTLQKNRDMWHQLTAAISTFYSAGINLCWQTFHYDFKSSHKVLRLPAYSWDLKEYWIPYQNDWCILKGAPNPNASPRIASIEEIPLVDCTAIHRVVEELGSTSHQKATVVVETDISREDINGIAQGHRVNGIALTTPSVYAEIGLSLGKYLLSRFKPTQKSSVIDVANLVVEKALIPHCKTPQLLRTFADIDWKENCAHLVFRSVDKNGKPTVEHGACMLRFTDRSEADALQSKIPEFVSRIKSLARSAETGSALRLNQAYGYKLISSLASFHPDYRAIDEVILDSNTLEACSKCSFGQVKSQGKFSTHPAYIDVMTQTAGFVMNGKDSTDLDTEVYVNHGWKSLQIFEEISPAKSYKTYVKMAQDKNSQDAAFWVGDTIMIDGQDKVVAFFKEVTLRLIPRQVFTRVLDASSPTRNKITTQPVQAAAVKTVIPPSIGERSCLIPLKSRVDSVKADEAVSAGAKTQTHKTVVTVVPISLPVTPPSTELLPGDEVKSKVKPALNIISEETGLALVDLTDDSVFADIGVDSLLSMVIASRFREELGLDLDLEFSLFLDLPTVKQLRAFLETPSGGEYLAHQVNSNGDEESTDIPSFENHTTVFQIQETDVVELTTIIINNEDDRPNFVAMDDDQSGNLAPALAIIAEESGLAIGDLTDDTSFVDIGVDSLLSMVISSRFREELGLDLDLEFSLFVDLPTVRHLRVFLDPTLDTAMETDTTVSDSEDQQSSSTGQSFSTPNNVESLSMELSKSLNDPVVERSSCYCRPATSVILQGLPNQASKILFLFPDGGGSSSSYEPLPKFKLSDATVIGLNCPYARDPENLKCNLSDLMDSYLAELRRRQPSGPYHLGGWSSGGIFAFLATQRLMAAGEDVLSLLIIDSPVPRAMDKLPTEFYEFCDSLGLFGYSMGPASPIHAGNGASGHEDAYPSVQTNSTPDWLIPHFSASVDVLQGFVSSPLRSDMKMPKVSIIWAGEAVLQDEHVHLHPHLAPTNSKGVHFLLEQRTQFGSCGWEEMLPGAEIWADKVEGANHFSMMQKPYIDQVGHFLDLGLA